MIPKIDAGGFLTIEAAERRIDNAILAMQSGVTPLVCVELSPINSGSIDIMRARYQAGGWDVKVEAMRQPNGWSFRVR